MRVKVFDMKWSFIDYSVNIPMYIKIVDSRNMEYLVFNRANHFEYRGYIVAHGDSFVLTPLGIDYIKAFIDRAIDFCCELYDVELMDYHYVLV